MARRQSGDGIREVRLGGGIRQWSVLTKALDEAVYVEDGVTYFLDNEGNRIAALVPVLVAEFAIEHGALRVSEA